MSMFTEMGLTPSSIVEFLDRYIIGQDKAKRAVAIALRNRIRRRMLPEEMAKEIAPKNILMVGPTGVGKTEIARRLAELVKAPFVKVEATKFTEVGYVGRDVESIIRDLAEASVQMVKKQKMEEVQVQAADLAEQRLVDFLLPQPKKKTRIPDFMKVFSGTENEEPEEPQEEEETVRESTRNKLFNMLREGKFDDREVEIEVQESSQMGIPVLGGAGLDSMGIDLSEMLGGMLPKKTRRRRMKVSQARRVIQAEEAEKLIDMEEVTRIALDKAQQEGIVFLDEIDKVVARGAAGGPDVSREGVQRDLLPVVEGCPVQTKYGTVHTDHILFISAGAFQKVKPSDLVAELQGRFPIRVELNALSKGDLSRILMEPENSLIKQYQALLQTENVELVFTEDGIKAISEFAEKMNHEMENIGARRLHTMIEQLLEELSFDAPEYAGKTVSVDEGFVNEKLGSLVKDTDMRRYLL